MDHCNDGSVGSFFIVYNPYDEVVLVDGFGLIGSLIDTALKTSYFNGLMDQEHEYRDDNIVLNYMVDDHMVWEHEQGGEALRMRTHKMESFSCLF